MQIIGFYAGSTTLIGEKNSPTGICKQPCDHVQVNELGIIGDIQVDKRFHGGPERALHQFSLASYEKIIKAFPLLHKKAQPGSLGENISSTEMHEKNVCIGDIYQINQVLIQVSSPRIPCWKIDAKLKQPTLSTFIQQNRLSGWYYRVLQNGVVNLKDKIALVQRPNPEMSIETMLKVINKTAQPQQVELAIKATGLDPEWKKRLSDMYFK